MATIQIDNEEVLTNLKTFTNTTLINNLEEALTKVCFKVEADSKKNCPAGTGTLRQSIQSGVEKDSEGLTGFVGSNLEYAPYVHQGTGIFAKEGNGRKDVPWSYKDAKGEWHTTSGIKPTPFIEEAIQQNRQNILDYFKEIIGND